jgi:hypothetical protein
MATKSKGKNPGRKARDANAASTPGGDSKAEQPAKLPRDVALLTGPTPDGEGAQLLRLKEGTLMAGELRPMREGQPLNGAELVRLQPMHPKLPVCAVETLHAPKAAAGRATRTRGGDGRSEAAAEAARRQGPARVSTDAYRKNWNAVFGTRRKKPDADYSLN